MAEGLWGKIKSDPSLGNLASSLGNYATAKSESLGKGGGDDKGGPIDEAKKGAKTGAIKGAISGFVSKFKGGSTKRPTNIVEDLWVGLPREQVWDAWNDWSSHPGYMKGPEKVDSDDKDDEGNVVLSWTAKIFVNRRSWKSTITESAEPEYLRWKSEGNKGVVDGAITFTDFDNATLMLVVIEYRSKGPIEWIGNRWRTVGRRVRLDLKHFRRYLMMTQTPETSEQEQEPNGEQNAEQAEGREEAGADEGARADEGAGAAGDRGERGPDERGDRAEPDRPDRGEREGRQERRGREGGRERDRRSGGDDRG